MKKYAVTGVFCLGFVLLYCLSRGFPAEKYRTLCDAFTVPGILCLCLGTLVWVSGEGFFHGLGYCFSVTRNVLLPGSRKPESYYDYVQRHQKKPRTKAGFLFVWGGICVAAALLLLCLV